MTPLVLGLGLLAQVCLVTGQLLVKHAMNATHLQPVPWRRVTAWLTLGITALTGWFFLWMGLLQRRDLSYVYPLEGLSAVLILIGAAVFLKEKLTVRSCTGIGLIGLGIALVAAS